MRKLILWSLVSGLMLGGVGLASATERDDLKKKISKYARTDFGKLRSACVCRESPNEGRAGWLYQAILTNQIYVSCAMSSYNAAGDPSGGTACYDFTVLAK